MDALYCTWRCVESNRILLFSIRFAWSYVLISTMHANSCCLLGDSCFYFYSFFFSLESPCYDRHGLLGVRNQMFFLRLNVLPSVLLHTFLKFIF